MNNEKISVPRGTLQKWLDDIGPSRHVTQYASLKRDELRALLAKPAAQPQGEHTAVGFLERMLKGSGDDRLAAWQGEIAMLLEHIAETRPQREPVCKRCGGSDVIDDKEKDELPSGHYVEKGLVSCPECEELRAPLAKPVVQHQGEPVACMPIERCYDVRVKMIIAFNEAKKAGGDLDDALDAAYKSALRYSPNPMSAEQLAPFPVMPPFAEKVVSKLRRFVECTDDGQGVDIGRHWFDVLTHLGLLSRVQRSPALWELTREGEDALDANNAQRPCRQGHRDVGAPNGVATRYQCDEKITCGSTQEAFERGIDTHPEEAASQ